jgi:hypothetical protein
MINLNFSNLISGNFFLILLGSLYENKIHAIKLNGIGYKVITILYICKDKKLYFSKYQFQTIFI